MLPLESTLQSGPTPLSYTSADYLLYPWVDREAGHFTMFTARRYRPLPRSIALLAAGTQLLRRGTPETSRATSVRTK